MSIPSEIVHVLYCKDGTKMKITKGDLFKLRDYEDLAAYDICFLFQISDEELEQVIVSRKQQKIDEVVEMLSSKLVWRADSEPIPIKETWFLKDIIGIPVTYPTLLKQLKTGNIGKYPLSKLHDFFFNESTEVKKK